VISAVEHPSVRASAERAERNGFEVVRVAVDGQGRLDEEGLNRALADGAAAVSIMTANNETGVLFPIAELADRVHTAGALFHTDAVQAAGKVELDVGAMGVDLLSLSAHKIYAAKGAGALYVREGTPFAPYLAGGEQEGGRRGGTENVAGIVGLGRAAELALEALPHMETAVRELRDRLEARVRAGLDTVVAAGSETPRLPNTSCLVFPGVQAEALLARLDLAGVCCSAGSACAAGSPDPSPVLLAMGFSRADGASAVRFSLGRGTPPHAVDYLLDRLPGMVQNLAGP
jgi:cysteine desulfurase